MSSDQADLNKVFEHLLSSIKGLLKAASHYSVTQIAKGFGDYAKKRRGMGPTRKLDVKSILVVVHKLPKLIRRDHLDCDFQMR